jgi:hypothetical protein
MPDRRKHRGPHPADNVLFDEAAQPALREAVAHVSWLLTKGYAPLSTLKLVGDRFRLTERQRTAVIRSACSDQALQMRSASEQLPANVDGESLWIDGFNLLTTIEAALAGGVILRGRDGCYRDMASMHGNYRKVDETRPALSLISEVLEQFNATSYRWYLDRPVSNSGRLSGIVREVGDEAGWNWTTSLVADPDRILAESPDVVVTADSWILDRCPRWFNLAAHIVRSRIPTANVIQMSGAV